MQALLVRHAESILNAAGYAQGRLNPPLSERGYEQAADLADALADHTFEQVYSSPLQRAYRTAERIAAHQPCEVRIEEGLAAADLGAAAGLPRDAVTEMIEEAHDDDAFWTPPGGEDPDRFVERVTDTINELTSRHDDDICVVTHGGPIRAFVAHCRDDPLEESHRIPQDNCHVNRYDPEADVVDAVNTPPASVVLK